MVWVPPPPPQELARCDPPIISLCLTFRSEWEVEFYFPESQNHGILEPLTVIMRKGIVLNTDQQTFSVKDRIENILVFASHSVSIWTMQPELFNCPLVPQKWPRTVRKCMRVCVMPKPLLMDIEIWISLNSHVSQNIIFLLIVFNLLKMWSLVLLKNKYLVE